MKLYVPSITNITDLPRFCRPFTNCFSRLIVSPPPLPFTQVFVFECFNVCCHRFHLFMIFVEVSNSGSPAFQHLLPLFLLSKLIASKVKQELSTSLFTFVFVVPSGF